MIFEKIENTNLYAKPLMLTDMKALMFGKVPDAEMAEFTLDLVLKITCDKNGKSIPEEKISVEDFINIQKYIMTKSNFAQKKS